MKRIRTIIAGFLLICMFLTACGNEEPSNSRQAVYDQWSYCLKVYDWTCNNVLWGLDYAKDYAENKNWDTLLKARSAISAAKRALINVELTGCDVPQDAYLELLHEGIDSEVVLVEYENLETLLDQNLTTITCMEEMLLCDALLSPTAEGLAEWIDNCETLIQLECQYLSLTTNYLLLQLEMEEQWRPLLVSYPIIDTAGWETDTNVLINRCREVLDAIAELQTGEAVYQGISQYTQQLVAGAQKTGRNVKLRPYLQSLTDVPGFFPIPEWFPQELLMVYQIPDPKTGESRMIQVGEKIDTLPTVCYISCPEINREEVEAYADSLRAYDSQIQTSISKEDTQYQLLSRCGDSSLMIQWTEENTVLYLSDPVACLVPYWYLDAILSE